MYRWVTGISIYRFYKYRLTLILFIFAVYYKKYTVAYRAHRDLGLQQTYYKCVKRMSFSKQTSSTTFYCCHWSKLIQPEHLPAIISPKLQNSGRKTVSSPLPTSMQTMPTVTHMPTAINNQDVSNAATIISPQTVSNLRNYLRSVLYVLAHILRIIKVVLH